MTRRLAHFLVTPEDAGRNSPHRSGGIPLYVFDAWLGDDLVRAYPIFLATTRLKDALETLPQPAGFLSTRVNVARSPFFRRHHPQLRLPTFWALEVQGQPGVHPLGLTRDGSLVVSPAALDCLVQHSVRHATFAQFGPIGETPDATVLPGPERSGGDVKPDAESDQRQR